MKWNTVDRAIKRKQKQEQNERGEGKLGRFMSNISTVTSPPREGEPARATENKSTSLRPLQWQNKKSVDTCDLDIANICSLHRRFQFLLPRYHPSFPRGMGNAKRVCSVCKRIEYTMRAALNRVVLEHTKILPRRRLFRVWWILKHVLPGRRSFCLWWLNDKRIDNLSYPWAQQGLTLTLSVPCMVTQRWKLWWMELSFNHEPRAESHMWKCSG